MVVFDANMPKLRECIAGCRETTEYPCLHRFPASVRVVSHTPHLERQGLSDLHVIRHVFDLIESDIHGVSPSRTQWIFVSSDKKFWRSAQHQYLSLNGHAPRPRLKFVARSEPGRGAVLANINGREAIVEVYRIKRGKRSPDTRVAKSAELTHELLAKRSS
jgi:hypothetical protein